VSFESFNFSPQIAAGIRRLGYTTPTPIQEKAIKPVMEGKDIMGLAETGTGKTAAFVLPISERLLDGRRGRIRSLVLAPTRELAQQTHEVLTTLGKDTKLRSVTLYGGVGYEPQIKKLQSGVEFAVAWPGRLLDLVERGVVDLSQVEVVVLDEADRMLDMGFLPDIRRILKLLPRERQTLLFTATMPADIQRLARDFMRSPVMVEVGRRAPVSTITHELYPVAPHLKTALLIELLRRTESRQVLVFTRTKHAAARLSERLNRNGFRTACLQGDMPQSKRQAAMDAFRHGDIEILVATDIAARGIDVPEISHVVNFDMPDTVDAYTHRVGRTARASRTGCAINLVTPDNLEVISGVEMLLNTRLDCRKVDGFDYDAPLVREAPVRVPRIASRRRDGRQAGASDRRRMDSRRPSQGRRVSTAAAAA